jgi:hypothetical protein
MYRYLTLLVLGVVTATGVMPLGASAERATLPTLTKISSRIDERSGVIAIEASEPVPYVASQPDARTYVVELRDVLAQGFADSFKADPRHPIGAVQVESAHRRRRQRGTHPDDPVATGAPARTQRP